MSKFFHQAGATLGVLMAIVPELTPVLPSKAGNVIVSAVGIAWTLFASLQKAFGSAPVDKGAP